MVTKHRSWGPSSLQIGLLAVAAAAVLAVGSPLRAQVVDGAVPQAVGGISINADGMLDNVDLDGHGDLIRVRARGLDKVPAAFGEVTEMRKVSLRHLETAVEEFTKTGKPLPQDIEFFGGLQQVRYVLVYPEQKDIVLVGPGEGWKVEPRRGYIVGVKTRTAGVATGRFGRGVADGDRPPGGITCSIDPTAEGLRQLQSYVRDAAHHRRYHEGQPRADAETVEQSHLQRRAGDQSLRPRPGVGRLSHEAAGDGLRKVAGSGFAQLLQMITVGGKGMHNCARGGGWSRNTTRCSAMPKGCLGSCGAAASRR